MADFFHLAVAWDWEYDREFVEILQDQMHVHRLFFYSISHHNTHETLQRLQKGELEFGTSVEDTSGWMIDETELWKRWQGPRRVFLAAGKKDAAALLKTPGKAFLLIAENKNTVILSNSEARH